MREVKNQQKTSYKGREIFLKIKWNFQKIILMICQNTLKVKKNKNGLILMIFLQENKLLKLRQVYFKLQ